jgi:hypothetical protein
MESVSLYSEARNEYIKQLATWVVPQYVEFFRKEYDRIAVADGKRVMSSFQTWCSEVPRWNQDVIDSHVNELLDNCRCDYIEDLMTAVFIAHTKMLTAIRVGGRQKKLQITLPKLDHFLHRVFVECARAFWKAPFLFSDEVPMIERQKNVLQAEAMCVEALSGAVRSLLPIKNILRDNLEEEEVVEKPKKQKRKYESSSSESESSEDEKPARSKPAKAALAAAPVAAVPELQMGGEIEVEDVDDVEEIDPTPVFTVAPVQPVEPVQPTPVAPAAPAAPAAQAAQAAPVQPVSILKPVSVTKEPAPVQLIKDDAPQQGQSESQQVVIDTEPSVKFSPYEMVYDENKPDISEMRYAPKMSIEEMPDKPEYEPVYYEDEDEQLPLPKLQIGSGEVGLSGSDMEIVGKDGSAEDAEDDLGLSDADFETI